MTIVFHLLVNRRLCLVVWFPGNLRSTKPKKEPLLGGLSVSNYTKRLTLLGTTKEGPSRVCGTGWDSVRIQDSGSVPQHRKRWSPPFKLDLIKLLISAYLKQIRTQVYISHIACINLVYSRNTLVLCSLQDGAMTWRILSTLTLMHYDHSTLILLLTSAPPSLYPDSHIKQELWNYLCSWSQAHHTDKTVGQGETWKNFSLSQIWCYCNSSSGNGSLIGTKWVTPWDMLCAVINVLHILTKLLTSENPEMSRSGLSVPHPSF